MQTAKSAKDIIPRLSDDVILKPMFRFEVPEVPHEPKTSSLMFVGTNKSILRSILQSYLDSDVGTMQSSSDLQEEKNTATQLIFREVNEDQQITKVLSGTALTGLYKWS